MNFKILAELEISLLFPGSLHAHASTYMQSIPLFFPITLIDLFSFTLLVPAKRKNLFSPTAIYPAYYTSDVVNPSTQPLC